MKQYIDESDQLCWLLEQDNINKRLGISASHTASSWRKTLYNKPSFAYESDALYFIDKLHCTFISDAYHHCYKALQLIQIGASYNLAQGVNLFKERSREGHFLYKFRIEIEDSTFGVLKLGATSNVRLAKIEVANEFLYSSSNYQMLKVLYIVASGLNMEFLNISALEIARDSETDYYSKYLNYFYCSDSAPMQIQHEFRLKYSIFGKTNRISMHFDEKDNRYGTVCIGSRNSSTQVKVYNKSYEIVKHKNKKQYIQNAHKAHFCDSENITRVEVAVAPQAVKRYGLDLLQVLNPSLHPTLFFHFLGNKLTFKVLDEFVWDKNRNKKSQVVALLPVSGDIQKLMVKPIEAKRTQEESEIDYAEKVRAMMLLYIGGVISSIKLWRFLKLMLRKTERLETFNAIYINLVGLFGDKKDAVTRQKIYWIKSIVEDKFSFRCLLRTPVLLWFA